MASVAENRQYHPLDIRYHGIPPGFDIEKQRAFPQPHAMGKPNAILLTMLLMCIGTGATAACYVDYKAKQDNPLRLHYGVAQVSACNAKAAASELGPRLAAAGWTLLNIVSVFDESGLAERKPSAGPNYLRF